MITAIVCIYIGCSVNVGVGVGEMGMGGGQAGQNPWGPDRAQSLADGNRGDYHITITVVNCL